MTSTSDLDAEPAAGPTIRQLDFEPPRPLRSPHLQSLLASADFRRPFVHARCRGLRTASRSRVLACADGTRLEARVSRHEPGTSRGVIVALHGWHGSADSLYLLSTAGRLFDAGFDVVRLHLRDHGGTHGLNRELFHSCRIDEAVQALAVIRDWFPMRPFGVLGFSLGGNFALRLARRAPGANIRVDRVVAVCPVLEPGATMDALDDGWFAYRRHFMRSWRASMEDKQAAFPDLYDFAPTRSLRSLTAMTDWFVERHTPYESTHHYLGDYTLTGDALRGLTVPTTILSSLDDPVIPADGLSRLAPSDALDVTATPYGGHCGFVQDAALRCWLDDTLLDAFAALA
ncbi:MAG TPA: alpha/beta fold hydrolase [Pseudomonadales bacterium]|nr:alpha/beta fold hydrolase [Pseudomonadales bacterium]